MDFIQLVYGVIFDLGEYRLVLSTRPQEQYIGTVQEWDRAEEQLKAALNASGRDWSISEGDGAFYGPKIDIILKDSDGKEHQTATIQLDFQLPQRFELEYTAPAPDAERLGLPITQADAEDAKKSGPVTPVLIHRAVLGSLERFLALLIEHYNGCYPFWISPHPVTILSVSQTEEEIRYVEQVAQQLNGSSADSSRHTRRPPILRPAVHVEVDTSARSLGKKIREAKEKGFNFIIVVGPQEVRDGMISLQISNQRNPDQTRTILKSIADGSETNDSKVRTTAKNVRELFKSLQNHYL
jgi:threonyl-tRNA synthetase